MTQQPDVTVIGGGVTGASTLYHLASLGATRSLLLDSGPIAGGFTGRSMAILRTHYSNEVTARMAWESLQILQHFEDIVGAPSGYVRTGYLLVAPGDFRAALEHNVALQKRVGVDTDVLDESGREAMAEWFALDEDEVCAYEPQSGYADSYLVTTGFASAAQRLGAEVRTGIPVTAIEVERGRVTAAVTAHDRIPTKTVIVAAGPWSVGLLEPLG
ncbi:MAG: FAD-dependent oxidoreductase, partial [Chloroflexi bacterium]|nr:FAD-dependent oxidoreductase [Chloroflexota bacterium]